MFYTSHHTIEYTIFNAKNPGDFCQKGNDSKTRTGDRFIYDRVRQK